MKLLIILSILISSNAFSSTSTNFYSCLKGIKTEHGKLTQKDLSFCAYEAAFNDCLLEVSSDTSEIIKNDIIFCQKDNKELKDLSL